MPEWLWVFDWLRKVLYSGTGGLVIFDWTERIAAILVKSVLNQQI